MESRRPPESSIHRILPPGPLIRRHHISIPALPSCFALPPFALNAEFAIAQVPVGARGGVYRTSGVVKQGNTHRQSSSVLQCAPVCSSMTTVRGAVEENSTRDPLRTPPEMETGFAVLPTAASRQRIQMLVLAAYLGLFWFVPGFAPPAMPPKDENRDNSLPDIRTRLSVWLRLKTFFLAQIQNPLAP